MAGDRDACVQGGRSVGVTFLGCLVLFKASIVSSYRSEGNFLNMDFVHIHFFFGQVLPESSYNDSFQIPPFNASTGILSLGSRDSSRITKLM